MTKKKKHPSNRAERLALKELLSEKQKATHSANIRRKLIKESLKVKETEDELREIIRGEDPQGSNP